MEPERYLGESGTLLNGAGPSGLWPGSPYTRFEFVSSGVRVRSVHRLRSGPLGLCPVVSRCVPSNQFRTSRVTVESCNHGFPMPKPVGSVHALFLGLSAALSTLPPAFRIPIFDLVE